MESNDQLATSRAQNLRRVEWTAQTHPRALSDSLSSLSWEQVMRVLRKHRWFLVGTIGGLTLATAAAAFLMRDVYQPTARLEIDPLGGSAKALQEIESSSSESDLDYLDTQAQILQGDGLAMRVIRNLHLDQNGEFVGKKELTGAQLAADSTTPRNPTLQGEGTLSQEQLDLANPTPTEAAALKTFHNKLLVNPIRGSRLVEVSFASHDANLAQSVTNSLIAQFIDQNYRNRYSTTMGASDWLSKQLNDLRQRVAESNTAVAEYQKRYGLVESDDHSLPFGQLMTEISKQLGEAQADRIQSEAYVRMIDAGQQEAIPALRDESVYQNLRTRYAEVRAQLAQAETVYGDENANVKKLQNEANELATQVESERARLITRLRSAFAAAQAREQMMTETVSKLRAKMGDESSHMVEYQTLKNEAMANAQLYNTLETRLREAGVYAGLRSGNIRVVEMAPRLHEATGPHRKLIVALGAMLSTLVGLTLVFARESFDNTVRIPDDIRNWLHVPSLAVLPRVTENGASVRRTAFPQAADPLNLGSAAPPITVYPKLFWNRSRTAEAEAIRALRTSFTLSAWAHPPRTVVVTSATAGEGKTTVAINLASVLAQQGKTCLIEGDLRKPMIELAMGLSTKAGLVEVLNGSATLDEAIQSSNEVPGLSLLLIKSVPDNPSDLLASGAMANVIKSLRAMFDYVVIDSPPVIPFSDARSLATLSDAVILVSRYEVTTRRSLTLSAEMLSEMHVPLMGVVLNDMDLSSADFHYFHYGYSWRKTGTKGEYAKELPPGPPRAGGGDSAPGKARGASA
jgi:polysaccharide biosynthesis transport protein